MPSLWLASWDRLKRSTQAPGTVRKPLSLFKGARKPLGWSWAFYGSKSKPFRGCLGSLRVKDQWRTVTSVMFRACLMLRTSADKLTPWTPSRRSAFGYTVAGSQMSIERGYHDDQCGWDKCVRECVDRTLPQDQGSKAFALPYAFLLELQWRYFICLPF